MKVWVTLTEPVPAVLERHNDAGLVAFVAPATQSRMLPRRYDETQAPYYLSAATGFLRVFERCLPEVHRLLEDAVCWQWAGAANLLRC